MKVKNINTKILFELKELKPNIYYNCKNKFPQIDKWISGEDYPTYNQLVELSKRFNIPFGYFFLEKLPERKYPIPHYRTVQNGEFQPSNELLDTILFAQKIQEWAKDILLEWGQEKLPFCGKYKNNYDIEKVTRELKRIFEIQDNWANQKSTWTEALNDLIEKAEEKGIIVLRNGVVGNNTHRKLNVNEFRGFVLYDEIAPVIFINNNDAISAKIFTLIHEVVHILIGQSASFDLRNLQSAQNEIEHFCDKCTAEFLVPEKEIKNVYRDQKSIDKLARHFKVSQIVILRRLLDTSVITQENFYDKLKEMYEIEIKRPSTGGGDFYHTIPNRLSKRFLYILNRAVRDNIVLFRDALKITRLSAKTYDTLIQRSI